MIKNNTMTSTVADVGQIIDESGQYLSFLLEEEIYGIDILCVQGIQVWETMTPLPSTPEHLLGVINMRGAIVPIVDLKRRFNIGQSKTLATTVIIIVRVNDKGQERTIGIVADAVDTVCNIGAENRREGSDLGGSICSDYIEGLAEVAGKMIILLDIERLLIETLPGSQTTDSG